MDLIGEVAPPPREMLDGVLRDNDEVQGGLVHVQAIMVEHASSYAMKPRRSGPLGHGHGHGHGHANRYLHSSLFSHGHTPAPTQPRANCATAEGDERPPRAWYPGGLQLERRFPVDVERDDTALPPLLGKLAKSVPSGSVELLPPFGFAFKREPDVFAAVGTGPTLGMGILLTEMSLRRPAAMRSPGLAVAAIVIAALSYIAATLLFSRFVLNATSVFVVRCEGGDVVCATRTLGRERSAKVYPAERVMSVDAVRADDGRMEVVVRGPRHEVLGTVYRLRALDPESLAIWLAEGVALVARKASQPSAG